MDPEAGKAIVQVLASVLEKLVRGNDKNIKSSNTVASASTSASTLASSANHVVTKFHALRPPSISVKHYLERIAKYASCSSECFVLALVYIDRLIQQAGFTVSSLNIHRVCITSIMLAAKFFDDHYYNNAYYAKIGGVPCSEMNSLELEFLFLINFTLYVEPESYNKYYLELINHAATLVSPGTSWRLGIRKEPVSFVAAGTAGVATGGSKRERATAGGGGEVVGRNWGGVRGGHGSGVSGAAEMRGRGAAGTTGGGASGRRRGGDVAMAVSSNTRGYEGDYDVADDDYVEEDDEDEEYYDEEDEEDLCHEDEEDYVEDEDGTTAMTDVSGGQAGGRFGGGSTAVIEDDDGDVEDESGMDIVRATNKSSSSLRSHLMMVHS